VCFSLTLCFSGDVFFLQKLKRLVQQRKGTVVLNCGYEMDYYEVLVNNFNWVFQPRNNGCFRTFGHPDEENRVLVGHTTKKVYDSKTWKKNVSDVIDAKLFQIFLIQQVNLTGNGSAGGGGKYGEDDGGSGGGKHEMYYLTFMDSFGICAADSLSVNATKLQYATKEET